MRKLVHPDFEIDLSNLKISDTFENSCFSDTLFTKISFPFEIDLSRDYDIAFGFISSYNTSPKTIYDVKYVENDKLFDATFEIIGENGYKLECTFEYGIEEFAVWTKKLSELPLHNFALPSGQTIYDHAKNIVDAGYPDTDYCFPAVHTDKYDISDAPWTDFQKMYNYWKVNAFPANTVDGSNVSHTRNIMQPAPFFLYILKTGFGVPGYQLQGDILEDPDIVNAFAFSTKESFRKADSVSYDGFINSEDTRELFAESDGAGSPVYLWTRTMNIAEYGEFHFSGYVVLYEGWTIEESAEIWLNGVLLYSGGAGTGSGLDEAIDFDFTTNDSGTNTLEIKCRSVVFADSDPWMLMSFGFVRTDEYDADGASIPAIENLNKVDLTAVVPDMSFGDFVKVIKNWHNYDLTYEGKVIYMNKVQKYLDVTDAKDLSGFETEFVPRKFQQGLSFLLKFADVESTVYSFAQVFQDVTGHSSTPATNKKTQPIEINALPLPHMTRNGIRTSHAFEESDSKLYVGLYTGLHDGQNSTVDPVDIYLPSVHLRKWNRWFAFRIRAQSFKVTFTGWYEKVSDLLLKRAVWYKNQNHIIKTMVRTEVQPDLYEFDIETESIRY